VLTEPWHPEHTAQTRMIQHDAPGFDQQRQERPRHSKLSENIRLEECFYLVHFGIRERTAVPGPGIVDQHIQALVVGRRGNGLDDC